MVTHDFVGNNFMLPVVGQNVSRRHGASVGFIGDRLGLLAAPSFDSLRAKRLAARLYLGGWIAPSKPRSSAVTTPSAASAAHARKAARKPLTNVCCNVRI